MGRKGLKKPIRFHGGGAGYMQGIEINSISTFSPLSIRDIVLWVQADPSKLVVSTIENYVLNLSPSIANRILKQYESNPKEEVIVEIESRISNMPNSLVRLELDTESALGFPKFLTVTQALDVIDMSNLMDPASGEKQIYKLTTKNSIQLSPDFSSWIISDSVKVDYIGLIEKVVLTTPYIATPTTTIIQNPDGTTVAAAIPTAEFSEVVVFSRKLSDDEVAHMDGYIAYRKNEQYLLNADNPYLPTIDHLPFMKDIASQIVETEHSLQIELESFDSSVENYRASLPTDPILEKAAPLKEKASAALEQISTLRKNLAKGGLLSRKKGTETLDSVFQSVGELSLYTPPLSQDIFQKKLADFSGVLRELQAYTATLGNVAEVSAKALEQNNKSDQEQQLIAAKNVEELQNVQLQTQTRQIYAALRKQSDAINSAGSTYNDALLGDFKKQMKLFSDTFQYYAKDIDYRWNKIWSAFSTINSQFSSGDWLTYVPSLDNSVILTINRGTMAFAIQYKDKYLNQIQSLYEKIRNQIKEGDFAYIKGECLYITSIMAAFYTNLTGKGVDPICKKTFIPYFKDQFIRIKAYITEFDTFYTLLTEAMTFLTTILAWNKENKQAAKLTKSFPISVMSVYATTIGDHYIREVNKHDLFLTMIEYVMTKADGTILYGDTEEQLVQLVFPSLEKLSRHDEDAYYTKKTPFVDNSGNSISEKYIILDPYAKSASIMDSLKDCQRLSTTHHVVDSLYELPRSSANCIYELSIESPQPAILLPKYALAVGTFYICINAGKIAIQIQIPGLPDDMIDTLGPSEMCIYNYTGVTQNNVPMGTLLFRQTNDLTQNNLSYYGRRRLDQTHLAYDMLYDIPRSSLCAKITELNKYIYMRTEKDPLFDKDGYLVETIIDDNGITYDVEDVYHSNPYQITIQAELHLSELIIHTEWNEKMIIHPTFNKIYVVLEASTGFPILCSSTGIPAVNEFGFCRYALTPIVHMNNLIFTRGAFKDPIEIQLNPSENIEQHGIMIPTLSFRSIFRSMFVKPLTIDGKTNYIFINSTGYPIVTPMNTYISANNTSLQPPHIVFYTDVVKQLYAYIPINPEPTISNTTILPIAPYPFIDIILIQHKYNNKKTGDILFYRFTIDKSYIEYTLAEIEMKKQYFQNLTFSEKTDTVALLQQSSNEIEEFQAEFENYSTDISQIRVAIMNASPDTQLKILIDTFDLKMKESLEKVFASFMKACKAIDFFKKIIDAVKSIQDSVKNLRVNIFIENEKSTLAIQNIIQTQTNLSNPDLSNLLGKMIVLKNDFEKRLDALEKNIAAMPNNLSDLDSWIKNQRLLLKNEYDIRKQIVQLESASVSDVYTTRLRDDASNVLLEIQKVRTQADDYISYKKTIALWLGIWSHINEQQQYLNTDLKNVTDTPFKGYSIAFPVFEELANPLFTRDWVSLMTSTKLSDAIRSRISIELVLPIQNLIQAKTSYYNAPDDTTSIPVPAFLKDKTIDELKHTLQNSQATMNNLIAGAIEIEGVLHPIFTKYEKIRSDLRGDFQKQLETRAQTIDKTWTDLTGRRTAIQTSLQLLEPYFINDQQSIADSITANIDSIMATDTSNKVQEVQQGMKLPEFFKKISYIKMIILLGSRELLILELKSIDNNLNNIQTRIESLQSDVLGQLQRIIETARVNLTTGLQAAQVTLSASISGNAALQTLTTKIQPKADALINQDISTIPACIQVNNSIIALNKDIQSLLAP